jgi:hypothetical protein
MAAAYVSGAWAIVGYQTTAILLVTAVTSGPAGAQGLHPDAAGALAGLTSGRLRSGVWFVRAGCVTDKSVGCSSGRFTRTCLAWMYPDLSPHCGSRNST